MPTKALATIGLDLFYQEKSVLLPGRDRRLHNTNDIKGRPDTNLSERITILHDLLKEKSYCRLPLKFSTSLGLINFAHNANTKTTFILESNLNELLKSNVNVDNIPANPDAEIIYHDTPYIYY